MNELNDRDIIKKYRLFAGFSQNFKKKLNKSLPIKAVDAV
jgi:hypothetical protein